MDQRLFEDVMNQTYNEDICFNPSKIFLIKFISDNICFSQTFKIKAFQEYLYRLYIDNPEVAKKHPSYVVRNIQKYGISDIQDLANDTLESWYRDAKNEVIKVGKQSFLVQVKSDDVEDISKNLSRLSVMLYKKVFGGVIPSIDCSIPEKDDHNLQVFGKGIFRNRVLEDMQYCPICEEINSERLVAVHLVENSMNATEEEAIDKANGLILCYEHAQDFIERKFYFDELGFVHSIEAEDIEDGMHLSFSIRSSRRKQYLKKRYEWLKVNS